MNRREVTELLEKKFAELEIQDHVRTIRPIRSSTRATVVVRGVPVEIDIPSGASAQTIKEKIAEFEHRWSLGKQGQRDLEELTGGERF